MKEIDRFYEHFRLADMNLGIRITLFLITLN